MRRYLETTNMTEYGKGMIILTRKTGERETKHALPGESGRDVCSRNSTENVGYGGEVYAI